MTKDELLRSTLEDLNRLYIPGLYEFLYKHREDLYRQLLEMERDIDKAFLNGTIGDLKHVLREYWGFHIMAFETFRNQGIRDIDVKKIRNQMLEEKVSA